MKVAIVYTTVTPKLVELVEKEVRAALPEGTECVSYSDPSILEEVRDAGYVTAPPAARLVGMFAQAVSDGADAILNCCSSVGEVADSMQDFAKYCGVPIVRIDEEMCREAVRTADRIAVMATLPTTQTPTANTILRVAREMNRRVEVVDCLVDGAFGLDPEQFRERMAECAGKIADKADVILFAQGSMAYCEEFIANKYNKKVFSSPAYGAKALKAALEAKGLM